jgi:poly-gamma-glutamate capsule biosynthesis protein CapA/YwtB (metallophosphatase superfamily)
VTLVRVRPVRVRQLAKSAELAAAPLALAVALTLAACEGREVARGVGVARTDTPTPSGAASGASAPRAAEAPPSAAASASAPTSTASAQAAPRATDAGLVRLAFVGDIALNYSIATTMEALARGERRPGIEPDFPFTHVVERLRAADLAIGNLECVLSTRGELSTWHKPFRCPLSSVAVMKGAGLDLVSVANNHSFDFGREGFFDMLKNLDDGGLGSFGRGFRVEAPHEAELPAVRTVRGARVGVLGYYFADDRKLAREVAAARERCELVIVYFHWGSEKVSDATVEQRRQARVAIDAGADLVVGSHVHVLQPTELYRGKLIAYGLGNFVFMGMTHEERFRRGAVLEVTLSRERLESFELVPTRIDDRGAPHVLSPPRSYLPPHDAASPAGGAPGEQPK